MKEAHPISKKQLAPLLKSNFEKNFSKQELDVFRVWTQPRFYLKF